MPTLHGLEPEQLARIGIFYLEEAVLDVLHEARHSEGWLEPKEISERLDIARSPCYHLHATPKGERAGNLRRRSLKIAVMICEPQGGESPHLPCGETSKDGELR